MLIDVSYFTAGPRHILNATMGTQSTEVNDAITEYIKAYQWPFLRELLGEEIGNRLQEYIESESDESDELLDDLSKRIAQSFADYVFYRIIGENNTQASITGIVVLKCANEYVSPASRQVQVWNRMVERNRLFAVWSASDDCPIKGIVTDRNLLTPINRFNL